MISTMRPDIDNIDEYVRNTTARAFAVVASALGIPSLLPFLKAVCKSKKSWQARHTGNNHLNWFITTYFTLTNFTHCKFRYKNCTTNCNFDGMCYFTSFTFIGGNY